MSASALILPTLLRGLDVQRRVIGAIIMRELHTRFGRDNIGYLWFILEPMLLASGITVVHLGAHADLPGGFEIAPFYITGYVSYMMFRSNVNRATAIIESNKGLLYHKQVTLFDLVFARCLLEFAAVFSAMMILLGLSTAVGLGHMPDRPLLLIAGEAMMLWFTTGLAMVICAASEASPVVERLVHPLTYLSIPVSGMFFVLDWLPEELRKYVQWVPMPQITDIVRMGQFGAFESHYVNVPYLIAWNAALTLGGFLGLRVVRRHMHFS